MRITIPDALAERYTDYATQASRSLDETVTHQLQKTATINPFDPRRLVLGQRLLEKLEARLGGGPIATADDLEKRFDRLASIAVMGIDLRFSPNMLEELAYRAARQGKTVEALAEEIASRMAVQFFDTPSGMTAQPRGEILGAFNTDVRNAPPPGLGTPIPGLANAPETPAAPLT